MIDLENAKKEFKKYISNYDINNLNIERKVEHSYRVAEISKRIAKSLDISNEEAEVAELIGLLHDIAKIDQKSNMSIYKDLENVEHGNAATIILERNNYIRKYIKNDKYDNIIKTAIINHSKYEIERRLDNKTLMFCKIIRDADKVDIFYEAINIFWKNKKCIENGISKKVEDDFKNKKQVLNQDKITELDKVVSIISFIYDINYMESFKLIKENDYINKIIDKFEIKDIKVKEQFEEIRKIANKFIENKIQKERL